MYELARVCKRVHAWPREIHQHIAGYAGSRLTRAYWRMVHATVVRHAVCVGMWMETNYARPNDGFLRAPNDGFLGSNTCWERCNTCGRRGFGLCFAPWTDDPVPIFYMVQMTCIPCIDYGGVECEVHEEWKDEADANYYSYYRGRGLFLGLER